MIGDIAQLGERVLCKHEVVGSIPSVSTIFLELGAAFFAATFRGCEQVQIPKIRINKFALVRATIRPCAILIDIVKRECGRLRQRKLIRDGDVRQATVLLLETAEELVFL